MLKNILFVLSWSAIFVLAQQNLLLVDNVSWHTSGNITVEQLQDKEILVRISSGEGWPLITFSNLPKPPPEANNLKVVFRLFDDLPRQNNIALGSSPADAIKGRYFNQELKHQDSNEIAFIIQSAEFESFRIAVKNPKEDFSFVIAGLYYEQRRTIVDGYGFESSLDMGNWVFGGDTKASLSKEWALRGEHSLKLEWGGPSGVIHLYPEITDWRPYKQLRFTLYNPLPTPNKKYRVLLVNKKYLPANCSIASGFLSVEPETVQEFVLDLDTLPESVDLAEVKSLQFFKGNPETVFYLDEMKLYTANEVQEITTQQGRNEINRSLAYLRDAKTTATEYFQGKITALEEELSQLLQDNLTDYDLALRRHLEKVNSLAALAAMVGNNPEKLILAGSPPTEKIFRDQGFAPWPYFQLSAAGHERESFQVVALPGADLKDVSVTASDLQSADGSTLSAANITINPVGYIEIEESFVYNSSRPGYWPDILVEPQKLSLQDRLQPYWITIYVPAGQKAGIYRGEIHFTAAGGVSASYAYELLVHDFSLPVTGQLLTFFDWRINHDDPAIRRKCYDIMLDHRLNPTSMYTNGKSPGSLQEYKFVPHPDDIEHCLSRGMNMLSIWYLYNGASEKPHDFDDEYLAKVKKFIDYYHPILKEKGALEISLINGFDEIMHHGAVETGRRLEQARQICSWLKKDYPELRLCNVGKKMDISNDLMDVWFMGILPAAETEDIRSKGGKVSFYWVYGNPSPMLDLPGMACRILSWQAFKEKAEGIGYYSTYRPWNFPVKDDPPTGVDWPMETMKVTRRGRNACGNMFYPAKDGSVLPSTRIANVRDGVEDYEYLAILQKLQPNHPLLTIPDEVVTLHNDGYTKDFTVIEAYRREVAQAIVELSQK